MKKHVEGLTHKGIIAGKLKGQIPAHTPSGSLMLYTSIPFDTLDTYSPICRVSIPPDPAQSAPSTGRPSSSSIFCVFLLWQEREKHAGAAYGHPLARRWSCSNPLLLEFIFSKLIRPDNTGNNFNFG